MRAKEYTLLFIDSAIIHCPFDVLFIFPLFLGLKSLKCVRSHIFSAMFLLRFLSSYVLLIYNNNSVLYFQIVDVLGWYASRPGFSCKHILDHGSSKGDGEYWIDPEKNGNPLKVYCDMTTDGGE